MNNYMAKYFQGLAAALLLVSVAGCGTTMTGEGDPIPPGTITIRENQVLRIATGGTGEGILIFRGWQHKFEVQNMVVSGVGPGELEIDGEVWNLENLEDFAGTYQASKQEFDGRKGLTGIWLVNDKGVRVHVRTVGQDLSIRLDSSGSVVTLK